MKIWWTSCHKYLILQLQVVKGSGSIVGGNIPPKIGMSYVEPELVKTVEAPVYHPRPRHVPRPRRPLSAVKHSMTEVVQHSLEMAAQEFRKIHEPKISKLKGGFLANAALIFNSWLKDIDMCVQDCNLTEHEAVQLVKDYMIEHAHGAVELYLDTNDQWSYSGLIEYLIMSFESGETFSSLLGDFYVRCQKPKETEDQFADELQVLARKVINVCPEWKSQVNEALKTQFAHQLWDQYFEAMACNLLKVAPSDMAFTKFWAECISIFGTRSKREARTTVSTNVVKNYSDKADQLVKSANQICKCKKKEKIKAQTEMMEQQKKELENLKAASMQMDPKKLIEAMTQAMACMCNTSKDSSKKISGT